MDLPGDRMTIRASKTEHHDSGSVRMCPIFLELRPYLEAAWDAADDGAEFAITRYRDSNSNLRTQLLRILARSGVKPWPKLFHNLRASGRRNCWTASRSRPFASGWGTRNLWPSSTMPK